MSNCITGRVSSSQISRGIRHGRAAAEGEADERQAVDLRTLQRQHRIQPEHRQRHDEDQIAPVELDILQRGQVALQQDHQHARQRQRDARRPAPASGGCRAAAATISRRTGGPADCSSSVFSAWVCSSAQYCMVLKAPIPVMESTTMMPSRARIASQSRTRCFQANGRMIRNASDQRRNDSVTGGICPAASRPTMALPAQHSEVMESSR